MEQILSKVDHTLLLQGATWEEIKEVIASYGLSFKSYE